MNRLLSMWLRGMTLVSRFVVLFLLARLLEPASVGAYGLMLAAITYVVLALGLDFYTFSTRELLSRPADAWPGLFRNQLAVHAGAYILVLPVCALLFVLQLLPFEYVVWFYVLAVLEHLAQELNRWLVAMGRPLLAGVVFFLRHGLWAWLLALVFWLSPESRDLHTVFAFWVVGASAAVILGFSRVPWRSGAAAGGLDLAWIRRGVRTGLLFLLATLAFRALFTLDRFFMDALFGADLVGAYTFYMGIGMALFAFLDSGVFVFLYPRVVERYRQGDHRGFLQAAGSMLSNTILAMVVLVGGAAVMIHPVLWVLDRPFYDAHLGMYVAILVAITLHALGMVAHYVLYAAGRDRQIVACHLAGLMAFLVGVWALSEPLGELAVPVSLAGAFALVMVLKAGLGVPVLRMARSRIAAETDSA